MHPKRGKRNEPPEKQVDNEEVESEDDLIDDQVQDNDFSTRDKALVTKICTMMAATLAQFFAKPANEHVTPLATKSTSGESSNTIETATEISENAEHSASSVMVKPTGNDIVIIDGVKYQKYNRDSMPAFTVPTIPESDKLTGPANLLKWKSKLHIHLRSLRLLEYITTQYGDEKSGLSIERRMEHDSQALQVIHATVTSNVSNLILHEATAYLAYSRLTSLFKGNRCSEIATAEERYEKLIFKLHHDPIRFVTEFDSLDRDLRDLGLNYNNEYLAARFLSKIGDKHVSGSQFFQFYHNMRALPPDLQNYEYVKRQFLAVDNSSATFEMTSSKFSFKTKLQ